MKTNLFQNRRLEEKLFMYMLLFLGILSLLSIIGNIIIGYEFNLNYKWIACILMSIIAFRYSLIKKYVMFFKITIFSIIIFILLPNGSITSGGLNEVSMAYLFLICISTCLIFQGKLRLFFVISEILVLFIIIYIETYFSHIISDYSQGIHILDMWFQLPLLLLSTAYIVNTFSNIFIEERKKLKEYSELLQEKNKKFIELSITDELTETYNRRYIFQRLKELKTKRNENNGKVMIIIIDIDDFKLINDTYGHIVGDEILKGVSSKISTIVNNHGFVGRYGGDEFIIVLEDISSDEMDEMINKIKEELRNSSCNNEIEITVSGGMVQLANEDDIDTILAKADKLLYDVKNSTKNNIISEKIFEKSL